MAVGRIEQERTNKPLRVLAVDGGGVLGAIPAEVLAAIEAVSGRPAWSLFDLIVGTSVGGLIGLMLTAPVDGREPRSAAEVSDILQRRASAMFVRRPLRRTACAALVLGAKYRADRLEAVLHDQFGSTPTASARTPVVVTTYDMVRGSLTVIRSDGTGPVDHEVSLMRDAARAAVAAPTYFDPLVVGAGERRACLIDGGVCANHPGLVALGEAARLGPRPVRMLSLGCGSRRGPVNADRIAAWSRVRWICPLLNIMTDGATVDHHLRAVSGPMLEYTRIDADLSRFPGVSDAFDDCRRGRMKANRDAGRALAEAHRATLERLAEEFSTCPS